MDDFEYRKSTPQYWYNKSSDLRAAAGAIWYCAEQGSERDICETLGLGKGFSMSVATYPVFPMLCGLSLELIYKAVCVKRSIAFTATHNLDKLASTAGVVIPVELKLLLDIFTESIIWDGKYPVPSDKTKDAYSRLNELRTETLFEEVKTTATIRMYKPIDVMNWDSFNLLWLEGSKFFYEPGL